MNLPEEIAITIYMNMNRGNYNQIVAFVQGANRTVSNILFDGDLIIFVYEGRKYVFVHSEDEEADYFDEVVITRG